MCAKPLKPIKASSMSMYVFVVMSLLIVENAIAGFVPFLPAEEAQLQVAFRLYIEVRIHTAVLLNHSGIGCWRP